MCASDQQGLFGKGCVQQNMIFRQTHVTDFWGTDARKERNTSQMRTTYKQVPDAHDLLVNARIPLTAHCLMCVCACVCERVSV